MKYLRTYVGRSSKLLVTKEIYEHRYLKTTKPLFFRDERRHYTLSHHVNDFYPGETISRMYEVDSIIDSSIRPVLPTTQALSHPIVFRPLQEIS